MRVLHVVLICLVILAIFSYTATTLRPLIQQENNFIPEEKIALRYSPGVTQKGKPGLIELGDPIEDPKPHGD